MCWNSSDYAVYTWCILVEMSGQHVPVYDIPVKFQGDAVHIVVYTISYIQKEKFEKRGNKQSYSNAT